MAFDRWQLEAKGLSRWWPAGQRAPNHRWWPAGAEKPKQADEQSCDDDPSYETEHTAENNKTDNETPCPA